jgi:hypothetical protein
MWPCTVASKSLIATDAPTFSMASPMLICEKTVRLRESTPVAGQPRQQPGAGVLLTTRADGAHAIERELVGALQRTYVELEQNSIQRGEGGATSL